MTVHQWGTALLLATAGLSQAVNAAPDVQFSGFLSVVGGKVLSGTRTEALPDATNPLASCPCYLSDWANFGVYEKKFSIAEESRIGVQATAKFSTDLRATAQIVSRGTDTSPALTWAYLSYQLSPNLELQVGRKRIPLYYYSDFQDIGVAYPWVTTPPELYGWDATNYNGASLRYKTTVNDAAVSASVFAGSEKIKDDRYFLTYGSPRNEHHWKNIFGGDVEVSKDWWTVRGVFIQAKPEFSDLDDPSNDVRQTMEAYVVAFNADFDNWFILSEIGTNNRDYKDGSGLKVKSPAYSIGAGYRLGKWTPFINYGDYQDNYNDPAVTDLHWNRLALTLRYDLTNSSAIKVQFDDQKEKSAPWLGDVKVLRISYDMVF
jgi:hypothetical protein